MCQASVAPPNRRMSSETKPMSRFARACSFGIACPSTRTSPASCWIKAISNPDRRALAGAVRADEAHDLAGLEA